jgi:5-bromo-4-chloroindolyl phosphate hydrolysis protein
MMHEIEITEKELREIKDALQHAEEQAISDRATAGYRSALMTIIEQTDD